MKSARFAHFAYLAILPVVALAFPLNAKAASGNAQVCAPGTLCTVGEFLYNDAYAPITAATCRITTSYPDGTPLHNGLVMNSAPDGWYSYEFTASSREGLYRTQVCCTSGSNYLCLDKTFEVRSVATVSASSILSAVWGYTGRTLTSFSMLVSNIWNHSTQNLAENNISDIKTAPVTTIQTATAETGNFPEQMITPTIENILEDDDSTNQNIQNKLQKSKENTQLLSTSAVHIKSKLLLLKEKWTSLSSQKITTTISELEKLLGNKSDIEPSSLHGQLEWFTANWNLAITKRLQLTEQKVASSLPQLKEIAETKIELDSAPEEIQTVTLLLDQFIRLIGEKQDEPAVNTLFGNVNKQQKLADNLDQLYQKTTAFLVQVDTDDTDSLTTDANDIAYEISKINQVPEVNQTILDTFPPKNETKAFKNRILALRGLVKANVALLLNGSNQPIHTVWLEEGSIVFKSLMSNPSKVLEQTMPLKFYLPKEVTQENVSKLDEELAIHFDMEKEQSYVSGEFTLAPSETKTVSVTVDESVFQIGQSQLASLEEQVAVLAKPLEHTAYFAEGVTVSADIKAALARIKALHIAGVIPEARVKNFQQAQIEYERIAEKLTQLKELTMSAAAPGTVLGFVSSIGHSTVWGLVVIMIAGFLFLAIYIHKVRKNIAVIPNTVKSPAYLRAKRYIRFRRIVRLLIVAIGSGLLGVGSAYKVLARQQDGFVYKASGTRIVADAVVPQDTEEPVLSTATKTVSLFVPDGAHIAIHLEPALSSKVVIYLDTTQIVAETKRQDGWVKISVAPSTGNVITGWVDADFIEPSSIGETASTQATSEQAAPVVASDNQQQFVLIKNTPTGFLSVYESPGEEEITKVIPGESFIFLREDADWVQIGLDDASQTPGWIEKTYIEKL